MPNVTGRSVQEVFDDLERLCSSQGYLHVLALLSLRDNMIGIGSQLTPADMVASYAPERHVRTEFTTLLGLALKRPIQVARPTSVKLEWLLQRTRTLLDELHECLGRPMREAITGSMARSMEGRQDDEADVFARGDVMREPIFYGGESAYNFQYLEFVGPRYAADDIWLRANKGFGIGDAQALALTISGLATLKLTRLLDQEDASMRIEANVLSGFCFSFDELVAMSDVPTATVRSVLKCFATSGSPSNTEFRSLGDFNIASAKPIVRLYKDTFLSLETYSLLESIYQSPSYWMLADKSYRPIASSNRGAFTEELTARRLATVFGQDRVHRGVNIMRRSERVTEADVLVVFASRVIVVQCKSKQLTLAARKGNDHELKDDFKKAVQDAYDQARLCAQSLMEPGLTFVSADGRELVFPELRAIYPVCVVSDHYPALAMQARQFLHDRPEGLIRPALVADVFLVDVMAEMLSSPVRFLSYLDRRTGYASRIFVANELAALGHHLRHNLWIDEGYDMLLIGDEESIDLDAAMTVRRQGFPGRKMPEGFFDRLDSLPIARIVDGVGSTDEATSASLGLMLLRLGIEALEDLDSGVTTIVQRAGRDGELHDITMAFATGGGLTVHCSPVFDRQAASKLAAHCQLRKHSSRADAWFGLFLRPGNRLPISGLGLEFPWKPDQDLEDAAGRMPSPSSSRRIADALTARKTGRNAPCPCGSGLKFKRCCGSR